MNMKTLVKRIVGKKITAQLIEMAVSRSVKKLVSGTRDKKSWTADEAVELVFSERARFIAPWQ